MKELHKLLAYLRKKQETQRMDDWDGGYYTAIRMCADKLQEAIETEEEEFLAERALLRKIIREGDPSIMDLLERQAHEILESIGKEGTDGR